MANTKVSKAAKGAKTQTSMDAKEPVNTQKKSLKIEDNLKIRTRSNQYGSLVFINSRTGDRTEWHGMNDTQDISVADVRDMKSNGIRFFTEPWIFIEGISTPGYEDYTLEDIVEALDLQRYYSKLQGSDIGDILEWDADEIKARTPGLTRTVRMNIIAALNTAIKEEELVNLKIIRAWERALQCVLVSTDGE